MTIKDFNVGQTAFITGGIFAKSSEAKSVSVTKIGKKYVTVDAGYGRTVQFEPAHETLPYLVEHTDYGAARMLFPTQQAIEDWKEAGELTRWLKRTADRAGTGTYALDQLRAVKRILEGNAP